MRFGMATGRGGARRFATARGPAVRLKAPSPAVKRALGRERPKGKTVRLPVRAKAVKRDPAVLADEVAIKAWFAEPTIDERIARIAALTDEATDLIAQIEALRG
jgi:hypothetical protein